MRTLIALLLLAGSLHAEPLKAVLVVPQTAISGTDVYLDGSQSTGDIEHYLFFAATRDGRVEGRIVTNKDEAAKPRMLSFPGEWIVTLIVVSEEGKYDKITATCTIPGGAGCPEPLPPGPTPIPPQPDPGPQPTPPKPFPPAPPVVPVIPAGTFGISPDLYAIIKGVKSPNLVAECKAFKATCDTLEAEIAAGALTNAVTLMKRLGEGNQSFDPAWQAARKPIEDVLAAAYAKHKSGLLKASLTGAMTNKDGWQLFVHEIGLAPGGVVK